jgi:hypothetical protein
VAIAVLQNFAGALDSIVGSTLKADYAGLNALSNLVHSISDLLAEPIQSHFSRSSLGGWRWTQAHSARMRPGNI